MDELTYEQHDAIAAYVAGLMSEAERTQFEQAMTQNQALREGVALEQHIRHGMKLLAYRGEADDLIQKARNRRAMLENNTPETPGLIPTTTNEKRAIDNQPEVHPEPTPRRSFPMAWAAAAVLALLFGIGWIVWWQQDTIGPDPIAGNDTTRIVQPPVVTDTSQIVPPITPVPTDNLLAEDNQRLSKAYFSNIPKLAPPPIPDEDTDADPLTDSTAIVRDSASVWRAARLLGRGQDRQAADTLLKVVVQGYPGHWRAAAEWYLSLTYLRQNRRQQARAILNRIARTQGHPYQVDAKRLRSELR